jgi:hypothetical protein
LAAAFDVTVVSCFTETRERSPLLLASARAAGHAATLAESRKTSAFLYCAADLHELLKMNDDAPWERSFQSRPFAVDVFGTRRWRDCHSSTARAETQRARPHDNGRV